MATMVEKDLKVIMEKMLVKMILMPNQSSRRNPFLSLLKNVMMALLTRVTGCTTKNMVRVSALGPMELFMMASGRKIRQKARVR